jgi:hypothetical protein
VTFNDFVIVVRLLDSASVFNIKSDTNLCPPPPNSTYELEDPDLTNPAEVIFPGKAEFPDSSNNVALLVTELVPAFTVDLAVYYNKYLL